MKKLVAMILALCLICGLVAMATDSTETENGIYTQDDIAQNDEYSTTIKANIGEDYIVTIPTELPIKFSATLTNLPIKASDLHLRAAKAENNVRMVCVQVEEPKGVLTNAANDEIPYTVKIENPVTVGDREALGFDVDGEKMMNIYIATVAWNEAKTGKYEGTLTFNVSVRDVPQN